MHILKLTYNTTIIIIISLFVSSCTISKLAMKKVSDTLAEGSGISFTGDDDPKLVGDALPFTIKLYETMLAKDSTNPALYLTTAKLICLYTQLYVLPSADTVQDQAVKKSTGKRAKKLFLRAREYSLKSIDIKQPGLKQAILKSSIDSVSVGFKSSYTEPLYWTAVSWLGAIGSDKSDLSLAMGIKKPLSITKFVISKDSSFGDGAAHELLGVALANVPSSLGGGTAIAEQHFKSAITLAHKSRVSTYVNYARFISEKNKNKGQYNSLLNDALSLDLAEFPSNKLQNVIYQEKARQMLASINAIFPDTTGTPPQ